MAGSEARLSGHLRVLVYGAELWAEMVAPDARYLAVPPMPHPTSSTLEPAETPEDSASRMTWLSWACSLVSVGDLK
jgi:hypothetical protein